MFFAVACLAVSLLAVYGLYAIILRCLSLGGDPSLSVSDGVHVTLGFSEKELEELLFRLVRDAAVLGRSAPVLLLDHPFRSEVIDELDAMGVRIYLLREEYDLEKRK